MTTTTPPAQEPEDPDTARAGAGQRVPRGGVIDGFRGRWAFLSNFHRSVLRWDGLWYPTAEHAFNAGKTLDPAWRARIQQAPRPGEAKRLGRSAPPGADWDRQVRYQVMTEVITAKFTGPARIAALLSTGDARLVEANTWHDQHWGDCRCGRPACAAPGLNHLGLTLMTRRAELVARGAS